MPHFTGQCRTALAEHVRAGGLNGGAENTEMSTGVNTKLQRRSQLLNKVKCGTAPAQLCM